MHKDTYPSLRILIVDDIAVHRQLMVAGLNQINPFLKIDDVANINDARSALLSGTHYEAVVCDRSMPGGDGTELVTWMRSMRCFDRVPFCMVSGHVDGESIIEAFMKFAVDAYIQKPFTYTDLHAKVMDAYSKRHQMVAAV
jgi:DNA-binding NtrC family response regulator